MYVEITIDLKHYNGERFDIRLSNYFSVKKMVDIVWQAKNLQTDPREGYWIRISNRQAVLSGNERLIDCGVTTGDCVEIL
ncbi:ubiquitin [Metabacillus sp. GX 13764]|uniref:EsaB/YukD family protein n=1 Tax=Metabacillus kandeliae TaxID=2900151 RepID=UPI001E4CF4E7|nr:EsaB/YukD family protein [Metabacillus kandeliae]MCD7033989.1 ubiquitin [Metabacillus kandeliae]